MSTNVRTIGTDIVRVLFDRERVTLEEMGDHFRITATNGPAKPPNVFTLRMHNGVMLCKQINQSDPPLPEAA